SRRGDAVEIDMRTATLAWITGSRGESCGVYATLGGSAGSPGGMRSICPAGSADWLPGSLTGLEPGCGSIEWMRGGRESIPPIGAGSAADVISLDAGGRKHSQGVPQQEL